jgi:hypothetical protein
MTGTASVRGSKFVGVALALAGAVTFAQPILARAADQSAPAANAAMGDAASKHVDAQIARLQEQLHITAAQMQQWNALAAVMRENAKRVILSRADRAKIHPTNVIDELYAARRESQASTERLERVIPAAEALFAVLANEQKAKANLLFGDLRKRHEAVLDTD